MSQFPTFFSFFFEKKRESGTYHHGKVLRLLVITWNPNIYLGSRCCFRCPGSPLFLVEPSRGFRSSEGFRSLFSTKKSAGSSFQRTSSERGPTGQGHVGHPLRSAWRRSGGVRTFTFAHLHGECRAARATFAEARERFSPFVREMAQKSPM